MNAKFLVTSTLAVALLAISMASLGQHGPKQRPTADRPGAGKMEQSYDRGQMQGRDQADQQDRQKAQEQAKSATKSRQADRDIYGYQLMTEQERNEYRERLAKAGTEQERQQISAEHRAEMQARAKERGVDLEETEESE